MSCFSPLTAYRSADVNPSGKRSLVFNRNKALDPDVALNVACGRCCGCRISKARQWAVRCVHEASLHSNNCFITLTFDDAHLDPKGSLNKRDFVLFMKRLRARFGAGIRFFHCGEYGSKLGRPHHHALLFNFDFPDKQLFSTAAGGHKLYVSETLQQLWPYGFSTVGTVTEQSAGYIARYSLKKVYGEKSQDHYGDRIPEYITMSNRPGIGKGWYDRYKDDVYPSDCVVLPIDRKLKPPKYYDLLLERENPSMLEEVKKVRKERAIEVLVKQVVAYSEIRAKDNPDVPVLQVPLARAMVMSGYILRERLSVRESVQLYKLTKLQRGYEDVSGETLYSLRC